MSTTVDSRVVEMRFDNKNFEKNVADTMSTVDKLQQKLQFTGATKGLEGIDTAAKKVDMSGLSGAVDTVRSKFSALEVMGVTALVNLTNSAVNAGKRMVSALTIDPIMSGFSEYETKMGAIQTIMANTQSKGTTMEDVTRVIGELNTYADKTIYNFAEMTRNIGTFTAAGIGLEESATAIQGIANLAAVSGSNSQQASTAMYQLSQAMAAGTVKLMDWNSVVNAGMGGQVFQDALKATARSHGVAVDSIIEKNGSFRESLQEGWITTEILTETLSKMTKSGASEYLSNLTGIEESQIKAAQELVANNKDGTASYEELATQLAATGKISKDEAMSILTMADNAEDAATKVKTFTQLWDTLKESAQSGWSQTWEILVGDFEEAKETLTKVSEVIGGIIGKSAEARNALLQGWKDAGGRDDLLASFSNIFDALVSVVTPIKEAFREIFPPTTVEQLKGFTEAIKSFTEKLVLSETASENLKRTFKGLFAFLDIIRQAFSAVFNAIMPLFGGLGNLGGGILGVTAAIGDWLVKLNETIKKTNIFNKVMQGIAGFIGKVVDIAKKLANAFKEKFAIPGLEIIHSILERVHTRMSQVGEAASGMKSGVTAAFEAMGESLANSKFLQMFQAIWDGIKTIGSGIAKAIGSLFGGIGDKLGNGDFNGIFDLINSISLSGIAVFVAKFVKGFSDIVESAGSFKDSIIGIIDSVRGCFEAYQTQLKAGALLKIASAIAILAASILVISLIDSEKLSASLGAITVLFADLMGSMAIFEKISGKAKGVTKTVTAMIGISVAVLILASALKKLGDLDIKQLGTGLLGITALMGIVVGATKLLSTGGKKITKGATQMILFAAAVKVLASVCIDLSSLSWTELRKGLVGVGVLMAAVSLFLNNTKLSGKAITTATGIVILGAAMKILASACADFGQMKWSEIRKGLASIGALLAEVTLFTKLTGNAKHVISTGVALIAIGAAMKIFASATKDMSDMKWTEIAKGLSAMAGVLLAVTLAVKSMPKNMIGMGVGLIGVSAALVILATALGKMGGMSWEEIGKGMATLGGSILILAIGLNAMKGALAGSAALLIATSAILVLTPALAILGAMSWESIIKSLVSLAGVFTILGVAGALLGPIVPAILGLSAALALIGVGVLALGAGLVAAGAGISAIAIGIGALATALAGGTTAIVAGIAAIIMGIVQLIPDIMIALGQGIIDLCGVIVEGAPAICEAFVAIILSLADAIQQCVPVIADTLLSVVAAVLASLVEYTPQIVDSVFKFLIGVLDSIAANLPTLIQSAVNVIMSFFSGVADALSSIDVEVLLKGIVGIGIMSVIMLALSAVAALVPGAMVGVLGMGAVIAELALVLAAIGALAQIPGLEWLIGEGGQLLQGIGTAIGQFIGGIVGGFMGGVSSQFPQIGTDLSAFMTNAQPFIDGAKSIDPAAMEGVGALAEVILLLTAANVLDGLTSWLTGGSSLVSFGQELAAFGPHFASYASSVSGIDPATIENSANAALSLAKMAENLPNQGGVVGWFMGENSLAVFAEELAVFGPKLKAYADSVVGLDANVVTNSANAAISLAKMAENLPNQGGVVGWFVGENSLAVFAEELAVFGPKLKAYSDSVTGLDPDIVTKSANAATSLAKMAENLPNQGGMVSWFTGDNKLSVFAQELAVFGPIFKSYSDSVTGINSDAVTASASAAQSLGKMAENLPNQGGMVSWFTGDNTLSVFGAELAAFGPHIKKYADSVKGIDAEAVSASANAATSLGDMAKNLPNQGGMVSWFTGDNTLSAFGAELAKFGPHMKDYADSVKGIDTEAVSASTSAAKSLTNMAKEPPSAENAGLLVSVGAFMVKFGEHLTSYSDAVSGLDSVAIAMSVTNANKLVELSKNVNSAFPEALSTFADSLKKLGNTGVDAFVNAFKDSYEKVTTAGKAMITKFLEAVKSKKADIKKTFKDVASDSVAAIKDKYDSFYNAGKYLVDGFAKGISENTYKAAAKAQAMAAAADKAARDELGVQSPSVVFNEIGGYIVDGLAEGITENTSAEDAIAKKAQNIKTAFENAYDELDVKDTRLDYELELGIVTNENGEDYDIKYARQLERVNLAQAKYNNLSSVLGEEDLETQKAYNEYLEERIELQDMAQQQQLDLRAKSFQTSKDWIEEQKSLGNFSLVDELYAWKRVQSAYEEGTEQRIEADNEILLLEEKIDSANNEYFNNVTERTNELREAQERLTQEYEDAVESRKKAIVDSHGLFDEVEQKDEVEGSKLIDNLMGQLEHNMEWSANMNSLSSRGILSEGLIEQLREMGPSAAAEISAMAEMTDYELQKYNKIWEMNNTTAENQARYELEGLKEELELENQQLIDDYNLDLETMRTDWLTSLGLMTEDTTTEFSKLVDGAIDVVGEETQWSEAGAATVHGILKGVKDNEGLLHQAMATLASSILDTFNNALGIASPSKEFAKAGKFIDEGLIVGIGKCAKGVYSSVAEMGNKSIESLTSIFSGVSNVLGGDLDLQPVISPVVDLSYARDGVRAISDMFGDDISMGTSANIRAINSAMGSRDQSNGNDDVVSAIDKLRDTMKNIRGSTYNINGVTYDDGSNIANAVETLVRAARVERRR